MTELSENMVLRTVYLPNDLDQRLKAAAIRGQRSKGDIIRELIQAGLEAIAKDKAYLVTPVSGTRKPVKPTVMKRRLVAAAKPKGATAAKRRSGLKRRSTAKRGATAKA